MPRIDRRFRQRTFAPALLLTALLGGCSDIYYDRREGVSFHAGDAIASNMAVQTIDPWPAAAAQREIAANGQRVQSAIERYRNNKVIPPQGTDTSSVKYTPVLAAPVASNGGGSGP
jgi:hypothetical protein